MQTSRGKKNMRCEGSACLSKILQLYLPFHAGFSALFVNTALTLSVELYPLLSLRWLSFCQCNFFSCLPSPRAVIPSPFPPLPSLPPTFLSHSEELSVSALPFIYCFNMLAGGERGGCCARPSVLSCHLSGQRKLPLTPTQLPVVSV